ncbi:MAG: D-glycerate dehydrogenase [Planctomycetota bacterium]
MSENRPKVVVTRRVYGEALAVLEADCRVENLARGGTDDPAPRPLDEDGLAAALWDAEGLLCQLTDLVTARVLAAAPRLRVVSQIAVGVDNIDVEEATRRGIAVTNTPGVLTEATADLAFALLLATARRLPEAERFLRAGRWRTWEIDLLAGASVHGKTLGIVGFGRIGRAVARRARGFSMEVLCWSRSLSAGTAEEGALAVPLERLLEESDFVSLHLPLSPRTRHAIGEAELSRMRPHAILVNTARGPIVDERALIAALRERRIAGAGLDVFEDEPRVSPELLAMENVVLLPHIGSATVETRRLMCEMAASDCRAVLFGERPRHPVNPEVLR